LAAFAFAVLLVLVAFAFFGVAEPFAAGLLLAFACFFDDVVVACSVFMIVSPLRIVRMTHQFLRFRTKARQNGRRGNEKR
jgi:hypothetical protein